MRKNTLCRIKTTQSLKRKGKKNKNIPVKNFDDYVKNIFLNTTDCEFFSNPINYIKILETFSVNLSNQQRIDAIEFYLNSTRNGILEPGLINIVLFYCLRFKNGEYTSHKYMDKVLSNWIGLGVDNTVKAYFHMMYELKFKQSKSLSRNSLRYFRIKNGYTTEAISFYLGIPESYYESMEMQTANLNSLHLIELCKLYNCSVDELLFFGTVYEKITLSWDNF